MLTAQNGRQQHLRFVEVSRRRLTERLLRLVDAVAIVGRERIVVR
jgi:hypothetical protein